MRLVYSKTLMDHFEQPRQVGRLDRNALDVGTGVAGMKDAGGVLHLQLRVGTDGQILDTRFKAYGPPALIAAGSWLAEALLGTRLAQAEAFDHQALVAALELPPARLHCALLAQDAARAAIQEFKEKQRAYA